VSIIRGLIHYPNRSELISEFRVPVLELCLFLLLVAGQYVSADSGNTSVLWDYQLPALQFDPLQERVVVREALSPGTEVVGTPDNLQIPVAKSTGSLTIPAGSIIYYSQNGITTVFDKAGKQIFSADDENAKMVRTQMGMLPATHVKIIPPGSGVYHLENATYVVHNNDIMYIEIHEKPSGAKNNSVDSSADKSLINSMKSPVSQSVQTSVYDAPVIESAVVNNPSFPLGNSFTARWIVPDSPRQTGNFSPTYLSTGLKYQYTRSVSGRTVWEQYDLKPAIEYDYSQNVWFISTCEYYRFESSQTELFSDCVYGGQVHTGDEIESRIEYRELEDDPQYPHPPEWGVEGQIKDLSTGALSGIGNWFLAGTFTFNYLNTNLQGDITNLNENTIIGDTTFSPINFPVSPTTYTATSNSQLSHLSVENNWPDSIVFRTREIPTEYTFSMTNAFPQDDSLSKDRYYDHAAAELNNVEAALSKSSKWALLFKKEGFNVTKELLGSQGGGLTEATLHYHTGHGTYNKNNQEKTGLLLPNYTEYQECLKDPPIYRGTGCDKDDYRTYSPIFLTPSDVTGKWGNKNKWIIISSCQILSDPQWAKGLTSTHGILSFETDEKAVPAEKLPIAFFNYSMDKKETLANAWIDSTIDTFDGSKVTDPQSGNLERMRAAVLFSNEKQFLNDHLLGFGTVEPDADPKDPVFYYSWECS
jgi:hypothetical protein